MCVDVLSPVLALSAMTGTLHNSSVVGSGPGLPWAASLSLPTPLNLSPLLRAGTAQPSLGAQWACQEPDSLNTEPGPSSLTTAERVLKSSSSQESQGQLLRGLARTSLTQDPGGKPSRGSSVQFLSSPGGPAGRLDLLLPHTSSQGISATASSLSFTHSSTCTTAHLLCATSLPGLGMHQ